MKKNHGYSWGIQKEGCRTGYDHHPPLHQHDLQQTEVVPVHRQRLDHETRSESNLYWVMGAVILCFLNLIIIQDQCRVI